MTYSEWKAQYRALDDRAARVRRMVQDRAKKAFDAAFGGSESYSCFHLAHNWAGNPGHTPAQRRACRYVLWLEREKLWAPSRIVRAWSDRTWPAVQWPSSREG